MSTLKRALLGASAVDMLKVRWLADEDLLVVITAFERQGLAKSSGLNLRNFFAVPLLASLTRHDLDDCLPYLALVVKKHAVTEDVEPTLSTRQCNTDAIVDVQKPNIALVVAASKREQYDPVLLALLRVHGHDVESVACRCRVFA